jgi:cell division transport system permease protein
MNWLTIKRIFRAGMLDFWRNAYVSAASITVMTVTLFVVGTTLFAGVILGSALGQLRDKADVNIYFVPGADVGQIQQLQQSIEARPEVAQVAYVSADQALENFKEAHANDQLTLQALDELGTNPLGAILNVRAKDISQYDAIAQFVQSQEENQQPTIIDKINYFDANHRAALVKLQQITDSAQRLGLIVIGILILTTLAIAFNTLRLAIYSSREEIQVQRLVGASSFFIRAPFMVEGVLYGLVAGVITLLVFYPLTWWVGRSTETFFGGINIGSYYLSHFGYFFLLIIGTGVVLGAAAAFLAVRRYLKI